MPNSQPSCSDTTGSLRKTMTVTPGIVKVKDNSKISCLFPVTICQPSKRFNKVCLKQAKLMLGRLSPLPLSSGSMHNYEKHKPVNSVAIDNPRSIEINRLQKDKFKIRTTRDSNRAKSSIRSNIKHCSLNNSINSRKVTKITKPIQVTSSLFQNNVDSYKSREYTNQVERPRKPQVIKSNDGDKTPSTAEVNGTLSHEISIYSSDVLENISNNKAMKDIEILQVDVDDLCKPINTSGKTTNAFANYAKTSCKSKTNSSKCWSDIKNSTSTSNLYSNVEMASNSHHYMSKSITQTNYNDPARAVSTLRETQQTCPCSSKRKDDRIGNLLRSAIHKTLLPKR